MEEDADFYARKMYDLFALNVMYYGYGHQLEVAITFRRAITFSTGGRARRMTVRMASGRM